jgi:tRNA A37 N6-isopentenylltransferase MiaA
MSCDLNNIEIYKRISDLEEECQSLVDCEFLRFKLKKEREINKDETEKLQQRISIMEEVLNSTLAEVMKLKKEKDETEKLQQRIIILEEENKQLKKNFKLNVINIVKDYIYSLFFFRK